MATADATTDAASASASAPGRSDSNVTTTSNDSTESNNNKTNHTNRDSTTAAASPASQPSRPSQPSSNSNSLPSAFLLRIPKADLHIHLDGSIRIPTLISLARQHALPLPSYDPATLRRTVFPPAYDSLEDYLRGFGYITSVLRTPAALERVAYEVAADAFDRGVRYLELRFAPQLHAVPGEFSIEEVLCAVNRGLERAVGEADELDALSGEVDLVERLRREMEADGQLPQKEDEEEEEEEEEKEKVTILTKMQKLRKLAKKMHPYHPDAPPHHYGIIACAMRFFLPSFGPYYRAFWDVHEGEDPHRVFGLASVALVTAVNHLRRKGRCDCHHCRADDDGNDEDGANDKNHSHHHQHRQHQHHHRDYILPVVAMDVAGAESGYPASDHKEAFALAHQSFLHKTVHAGEAYGPESIFSAITDLHAERIGHGLHLFRWDVIGEGEGRGRRTKSSAGGAMTERAKKEYVENLTRYLGSMRICLEVCLSSNLQTMPELKGDIRNHPARKMIEEGLAVAFCTDNTLVSHTDMVRELKLAVEAFDLRPGQLRNIVYNGFKRSFMAKRYREKRDYNRKVISYYKRIEREFGLSDYASDFEEDRAFVPADMDGGEAVVGEDGMEVK